MGVPDIETIDLFIGEFEKLGYEPKGEYGILGRRYFRKGKEKRTHHIHVFRSNSHNAVRHLAFRDYLISHPLVAKEYQSIKIQAAEQCNGDNKMYCELKNDFVVYHENLAVQWTESVRQKDTDLPSIDQPDSFREN